jgi:hypothetical protein
VSPAFALAIASRKVLGPLSALLVTVIVDGHAGKANKQHNRTRTRATRTEDLFIGIPHLLGAPEFLHRRARESSRGQNSSEHAENSFVHAEDI